jgi:hypothetical protein
MKPLLQEMERRQTLLFGMGGRQKLLYLEGGRLVDALTFEPIRSWEPEAEDIQPHEYRVRLRTRGDAEAMVFEDEEGVWLEEGGNRELLTHGSRVNLPRFEGHPYAGWLRALHAELLVNIMPAGPVPNLWVYPRPWYRDAAMVLMCLQATRNLGLVEPWVMGLHKIWDRNNAGDAEADNLGQVLFMAGLFGAHKHPLIQPVLDALPGYRKDRHIVGRTDGAEHPVYQTKWLKLGLKTLGLDDPFRIPAVFDSYSSLFWMDYRSEHVAGDRFSVETLESYPYLNWAEAHFFDEPPPEPLGDIRFPLSREGKASEADYWRLIPLAELGAITRGQLVNRVCTPHTWHAAEMFLYLMDPGRA